MKFLSTADLQKLASSGSESSFPRLNNSRRLRRVTHVFSVLIAMAFHSTQAARAANGTYITNFYSAWWEDSINWSGGTIASGVDATANFFQPSSHVYLGSPKTIGKLVFGDGQYSINGEPIVLSVSDNDGAEVSVGSSLFATGAMAFWNRVTGNDALVKTGDGTLYLNDPTNSYTSLTWFMGGRVVGSTIANDGVNSTFGRGGFAFDGGAVMEYSGVTASTNRDIHLQGYGRIDVSNADATLTFTGSINGAGAFGKEGEGDLITPTGSTFTGNANVLDGRWIGSSLRNTGQTSSYGAGGIVNIFGGTLVYTGANQTTNREFLISDGTVDVTNAATTLNMSGWVHGGGVFNKVGPGSLTLSGAVNNTSTGAIVVKEGVLNLQKTGGAIAVGAALTVGDGTGSDLVRLGASNQIADTSLVTVASSGVMDVNGFSDTIGALSGSGVVENSNIFAFSTLTVSGSQNTTFSGLLRNGAGGGPMGLTRSGTGTLTLTQPATITGGVTVSGGKLKLQASNTFPANASFSIFGGTLEVGATETTNSVFMLGGALEGGSLVANDRFEIQSGTVSANLAGNGRFEKGGGGDLTFSGVGTYSGATNILSGTMTLVGAERLPNATDLTVDGQLILGGAETIGSLAGTGGVELHGELTVGNALNTQFSGDLTGTGTLRKVGSGALDLRGSSSHDGTIIEGGHIFASTEALHGQITNNSSIYMVQQLGNDGVFSGVMTGSGAFNKSGSGKFTVENAQFQTTGPMHVHDGTLALPSGLNINGGNTLGSQPQGAIEAAGYVYRRMTSEGRITATGDLLIGDLSSTDGFRIVGTLEVGAHDVVLLDRDAALLGVSTTIAAGGQLTGLHGLQLEAGDTLSATGTASVRGALENQGIVAGPSLPGDWLTLEDDVTGAGNFTGNVHFGDGFSPGNSPATVTFENVIFDESSVLRLEFGGDTAGSEYDQLVFTGSAQLNGKLVIDFIDLGGGEFLPAPGDVFELFSGNVTGSFDSVELPDLPANLAWDATALATGAVTVAAVPPSSDFNSDGHVDGEDFLTLQRGLGVSGANLHASGDADRNGAIDAGDLSVWVNQFGTAPAIATAVAHVPEPGSLLLALAGMSLAARNRRGRNS